MKNEDSGRGEKNVTNPELVTAVFKIAFEQQSREKKVTNCKIEF